MKYIFAWLSLLLTFSSANGEAMKPIIEWNAYANRNWDCGVVFGPQSKTLEHSIGTEVLILGSMTILGAAGGLVAGLNGPRYEGSRIKAIGYGTGIGAALWGIFGIWLITKYDF